MGLLLGVGGGVVDWGDVMGLDVGGLVMLSLTTVLSTGLLDGLVDTGDVATGCSGCITGLSSVTTTGLGVGWLLVGTLLSSVTTTTELPALTTGLLVGWSNGVVTTFVVVPELSVLIAPPPLLEEGQQGLFSSPASTFSANASKHISELASTAMYISTNP